MIVLTAAQRLKARGFGVDIDPELVKLANNEAKKRGVADRASFEVQDVFKADISRATVVTLYLLPGMMINLRLKIFEELKPGTRVVSHDYHFDDWRADDQYTWDVPEKEKINGVPRGRSSSGSSRQRLPGVGRCGSPVAARRKSTSSSCASATRRSPGRMRRVASSSPRS